MNTGESDTEMVWVNGQITPTSEAMISVSVPGVALGLGFFETIYVEKRRFFKFENHYERLKCGVGKAGANLPLASDLRLAILQLVEINGYQTSSCRVRISCYVDNDSTFTVVATSAMPVRGATASTILSPYRVNEYSALVGLKSSSYAMNILALREAQELGSDEALMLNTAGELCEGTTSNLFLVKSGEVHTPHIESGCLPGIARGAVIELCEELGIPCFERALSINELHDCDAAFLTSSLRRVHPISSFDGKLLASAEQELVVELLSAYEAKVYGPE